MTLDLTGEQADLLITILISGRSGLRGAAQKKRELGDDEGSIRCDKAADFSEELSNSVLRLKALS